MQIDITPFINREIARYALENKCIIISDDGDMFVMSAYGMIILSDCVRLSSKKDEELRCYDRRLFTSHFDITVNHLYYLAIMNGNDYTKKTSLRRVFSLDEGEKQTFEHSVLYVTEVVNKNASLSDLKEDYCRLHPFLENADEIFDTALSKYTVESLPPYPYCLFPNAKAVESLKRPEGLKQGSLI